MLFAHRNVVGFLCFFAATLTASACMPKKTSKSIRSAPVVDVIDLGQRPALPNTEDGRDNKGSEGEFQPKIRASGATPTAVALKDTVGEVGANEDLGLGKIRCTITKGTSMQVIGQIQRSDKNWTLVFLPTPCEQKVLVNGAVALELGSGEKPGQNPGQQPGQNPGQNPEGSKGSGKEEIDTIVSEVYVPTEDLKIEEIKDEVITADGNVITDFVDAGKGGKGGKDENEKGKGGKGGKGGKEVDDGDNGTSPSSPVAATSPSSPVAASPSASVEASPSNSAAASASPSTPPDDKCVDIRIEYITPTGGSSLACNDALGFGNFTQSTCLIPGHSWRTRLSTTNYALAVNAKSTTKKVKVQAFSETVINGLKIEECKFKDFPTAQTNFALCTDPNATFGPKVVDMAPYIKSDGVARIPFFDLFPINNWRGVRIAIHVTTLDAEGKPYGDQCVTRFNLASPLVLDFTGKDLIRTLRLGFSNTHFDLDADGSKERTGWIVKGQALLTLDRNSNGIIDDGRELFGDNTEAPGVYDNGFSALSSLDSNSDGHIDAQDDRFDDLRLWFDDNQDGISSANELKSLADAGVTSIDLSYRTVSENRLGIDASNDIRYASYFFGPEKCGAKGCAIFDVYFATETK